MWSYVVIIAQKARVIQGTAGTLSAGTGTAGTLHYISILHKLKTLNLCIYTVLMKYEKNRLTFNVIDDIL